MSDKLRGRARKLGAATLGHPMEELEIDRSLLSKMYEIWYSVPENRLKEGYPREVKSELYSILKSPDGAKK